MKRASAFALICLIIGTVACTGGYMLLIWGAWTLGDYDTMSRIAATIVCVIPLLLLASLWLSNITAYRLAKELVEKKD